MRGVSARRRIPDLWESNGEGTDEGRTRGSIIPPGSIPGTITATESIGRVLGGGGRRASTGKGDERDVFAYAGCQPRDDRGIAAATCTLR